MSNLPRRFILYAGRMDGGVAMHCLNHLKKEKEKGNMVLVGLHISFHTPHDLVP